MTRFLDLLLDLISVQHLKGMGAANPFSFFIPNLLFYK